jgi:TetR/AcrR family transcriptional regulator, cholesterol catabolism regulator
MPSRSRTGPRPSRRERSKADKMRRILTAGEKLFSSQGFDGTTVQQIADEADVAVGTLFLYVSDKSELLLRLFHRAIDIELKPAARRLKAGRKFVPAVRRFLTDMMAPYQRDRELARFFWREFLFHQGEMRSRLDQQAREILEVLAAAIAAAQARSEIDPRVEPSAGALEFYAIFHSTLAFHLADCLPGESPGATLDALLQLAWQGMAPRGL